MTLTPDDLAAVISKAVAEQLDAALPKFEEASRKAIHAGAPDEDINALQGVEKAARWLKALGQGDLVTVKALSEGVGADGGFIVPTEFRAIVTEKLYKQAVIRPNAQVIPMTRNKLEVPVEGASVTATWTAENAAATESNPTFAQVVLDTNKLTGLSKMSRELLADTPIELVNYVAGRFARVFAQEEDKAFMAGSGTGQPKGIRTYTITSTAQAGANLAADDLISLWYSLPSQYRSNAFWLIHNDVIAKVRKLKDSEGRYLWTDGFGEAPATILGRPVLEQNDIPVNLGVGSNESEIFVGDLQYYLVGDRQTMEVEQSTQSGDAFEKHQLWVKVIERLDGQLALTDAFRKLTGVK